MRGYHSTETCAKPYKTDNFVIPVNPGSVSRQAPDRVPESSVFRYCLDSGSVIPDIDPGPE
jgi:hypothetical protein